jgi:hypothetical protein
MRCWRVIGRFASAILADLVRGRFLVGAASGFEDSGLMGAFAFCFPFAFFVGLMQGVGVDGGGGHWRLFRCPIQPDGNQLPGSALQYFLFI